jgi:hypothetical protein
MFIPDPNPDFYPSRISEPETRISDPEIRIPDPTAEPKEEGENFFCPSSFCSHKCHKILNNFIFVQVKKIFSARTLRIIVLLTQRFVSKISKIWVWDPRSGTRKKPIPGPGSRVKKAPDPGSATLMEGFSRVSSAHNTVFLSR